MTPSSLASHFASLRRVGQFTKAEAAIGGAGVDQPEQAMTVAGNFQAETALRKPDFAVHLRGVLILKKFVVAIRVGLGEKRDLESESLHFLEVEIIVLIGIHVFKPRQVRGAKLDVGADRWGSGPQGECGIIQFEGAVPSGPVCTSSNEAMAASTGRSNFTEKTFSKDGA